MASIEKRGESYRIVVSCGYSSGKKRPPEKMTWKPEPGMTDKQINKEIEKIAFEFEAKVKGGHYLDGEKLSFAEFSERWLTDYAEQQLKPKTIHWYRRMLSDRVIPAIGHHKLAKLQPAHLIKFSNELQLPGVNQCVKYCAKNQGAIESVWKASGKKVSDGIPENNLTAILNCRNVNFKTAEKFSKLMGKKVKDLFKPTEAPRGLSSTTVGHYLRCVSTVLSTAVAWQILETNPCERVKPPRASQKVIKHLDIDEAQDVITAALGLKDQQVRIIVLILMYTGIRRAELSGLQWPDIDLENGTIMIHRTLQQIPGKGFITADTKSASGERLISISPDLITYLRRYKSWQSEQQLKYGTAWQEKEHMAAVEANEPFSPVEWVITADSGYPLNPSTVYHRVKRFLIANGQADMTVHGLRHTNISLMLGQGVDLITASRRAGHAKPSTTGNIYAHALRRPDEKAADTLNTLFKQPLAK